MPHLEEALGAILREPSAFGASFEPVVALSSGEVSGYHVVGRLREPPTSLPGVLGRAELVELSHATGQLLTCERRLREVAIEALSRFAAETPAWFAIDVDPRVVGDPSFSAGHTRAVLARHGVPADRVVLALAEAGAGRRVDVLSSLVRHYTHQGFRVALGGVGPGVGSLLAIVRMRPQLVELDSELIQGVHRDAIRTNLLHALAEFGRRSDIALVASGIESADELAVVMGAGVPLARGALFGTPGERPAELPAAVRSLVREHAARLDRSRFRTARRATVGSLDITHPVLRPHVTCEDFDGLLRANPNRPAYPVIDDAQRTLGLVTRESFFEKTSGPFGFAYYARKPLTEIMERKPLRIDASTSVHAASRLATARPYGTVNHPVVVESAGRYVGLLSVQKLLEVVTELELRHATYASPLTGLPGNVVIDAEIRRALETGRAGGTAFVYVDIDNFKALNDAYGFAVGDDVLRLLAEVLRETFEPLGEDVLVGHVGGDDFVVVAPEDSIEAACTTLGTAFDRRVGAFYAPGDLARGGIVARDRSGEPRFFPVAALSIAIVVELDLVHQELHDVARVAADLKRRAKRAAATHPTSRWVKNRRRADR